MYRIITLDVLSTPFGKHCLEGIQDCLLGDGQEEIAICDTSPSTQERQFTRMSPDPKAPISPLPLSQPRLRGGPPPVLILIYTVDIEQAESPNHGGGAGWLGTIPFNPLCFELSLIVSSSHHHMTDEELRLAA